MTGRQSKQASEAPAQADAAETRPHQPSVLPGAGSPPDAQGQLPHHPAPLCRGIRSSSQNKGPWQPRHWECPAPPQGLRLQRQPSPKAKEPPGLNQLSQAPPTRPLSPSAPGSVLRGSCPAWGHPQSDCGPQLLPSPDLGALEDTDPGAAGQVGPTPPRRLPPSAPAYATSVLPYRLPHVGLLGRRRAWSVPNPREQGTLKGPSRRTVQGRKGQQAPFPKGKAVNAQVSPEIPQ